MKPIVALFLLSVVACGGDSPAADGSVADATPPLDSMADARAADALPADAQVDAPDLACVGMPAPTTAIDPLVIRVTVFDASAAPISALSGVGVQARRASDGQVLAEATSDDSGQVVLSIPSGGNPLPGYITLRKLGYVDARFVPVNGFYEDIDMPLALATNTELDAWYAGVGEARSPNRGTVVAFSLDCAGEGLDGSTISVTGATTLTYWNDQTEQWDPQLTTATNSFALATNVPTGATTVAADYVATALPSHTIAVRQDELTFVGIEPR